MKHSPSCRPHRHRFFAVLVAPRPGAGAGCGNRGTAAVEFALVVPIILSVLMGSIEFGRAFMVLDLLSNVARQGARTGSVSGRANSDITTAVDTALTSASLPSRSNGTTLSILVNKQSADASTAVTN